MKTSDKIIEYIKKNKQATGFELSVFLEITGRAVRKQLKSLLEAGVLEKIGTTPKVFYKINKEQKIKKQSLRQDVEMILNEHFYHISPRGKELVGKDGFVEWCSQRNFDVHRKADEFIEVTKKYQKLRKYDLFDATSKLKNTFSDGANELFYYDFYSVEVFGKTKIGQKLLYAKQSENRKLMKELSTIIKPALEDLIKRKFIDAVAYVQPTVPRQIQFMKVLEKELSLSLPKITITKVIADIRVPQKTLKKLADRIENANETFVVEGTAIYNKVLLIDDAVGSGASINQVALKIKEKGLAKQVIGFAITGSLNDFDVISEA
jgi:predicted RNase H-related nuclease YkuK (DUF458 family)